MDLTDCLVAGLVGCLAVFDFHGWVGEWVDEDLHEGLNV